MSFRGSGFGRACNSGSLFERGKARRLNCIEKNELRPLNALFKPNAASHATSQADKMPDIPPFVLNEDPERVNDTQTALITGVVASVHLVALVIFATRSFIRLVVLKSPGIQDAFMGIATVSFRNSLRRLPRLTMGGLGYNG